MRLTAIVGIAVALSGCASLRLPVYTPTPEQQTAINACGAETAAEVHIQFCRVGRRTDVAVTTFDQGRRATHKNQMALQGALIALGISAAGAALADIHSSTLNSLAFLSGATTAYLSYSNPSSKHDLYTDAWVKADCLARVPRIFAVPVRDWEQGRKPNLAQYLIQVRRTKGEWQQKVGDQGRSQQARDHANEAVQFLTALEESLVAAIALRSNAEGVYHPLPFRLEESLVNVQRYAEQGVRTRTGSYEDFLTRIRADAEKIAGSDENTQVVENQAAQLMATADNLRAQQRASNFAAADQFKPEDYDGMQAEIAEVARLAPLLVDANVRITACIAGL